MSSKRSFYKSIDFWIVSFIFIISILYAYLCEVFPTDWVLSTSPYKKNNEYFYKKSWRRLLIATDKANAFDITSYFEDPENLFKVSKHYYKNQRNRTKVALVEIEGFSYVVKKFRVPTFLHWLRAFPCQSSKAFRSWHYGIKLAQLGIPTPEPILIIENRIGPFWTSSYLVTTYIPSQTAQEYFSDSSPFLEKWPVTMKKLDCILDDLNQNLVIHGKLSLNNILVSKESPYLISLDRVHSYHFDHAFYARRSKSQHIEKLNRKMQVSNPQAQSLFEDFYEHKIGK